MEAKINQLAPVEDFDKAYIIAQYAHEQGFRGTTFPELLSWLQTRLDLTGTDLIDPTSPGIEANPAVIPPGPAGKKGKFEPSPGFYQGFPEVTADKRWYFYWDGSSWTLVDMGPMPDNAAKAKDWQTGEDYERNTIVSHNDLQWIALVDTNEEPDEESGAWQKFSPTPLKDEWDVQTQMGLSGEGIGKGIVNNFQGGQDKVASAEDAKELDRRVNFVDRPDLKGKHYLVDRANKVIDRLLGENHDGPRMWPEGMSVKSLDRPDLGAIILADRYGKLLSHSGYNKNGSENSSSAYQIPAFEPGEQQSFSVPAGGDDSPLSDYNALVSEYESLMGEVNIPLYQYITSREIGTSAVGNMPIKLYSLKPVSPKAKILLVGGTHAAEKMYIDVLRHFSRDVALNWDSDPYLNFLRWNIQIDILPCRMPYVLKSPKRARGTRCSPETSPIPFVWTKTGNTVTLTFNTSDFPNDGVLTGEDYFTAVPASQLINRQAFHVSETSDETGVPVGLYAIKGVNSGNSITFHTPNSDGASAGTGFFQVWVDPNRNMAQEGSPAWGNYNSNLTEQFADDGTSYTYMVSKGTRPFSLRENRAFIELIQGEQYDVVLDGHAPANDNYLTYDGFMNFIPNKELVLSKSLANTSIEYIRDSIASAHTTPYSSYPIGRDYGVNFWTVEWGSGLNNATGQQVKDAYRWLTIVITEALNKKLNK